MANTTSPDRDTLLMMLSAYLDGEVSAEDEALVHEALAQDHELLLAFEEMTAARLPAAALLAGDAEALTASILAATGSLLPATAAGMEQLASLAVDGALDDERARQLELLLQERPGLAPAATSFLAATEAVQIAARAVGEGPVAQRLLQDVPARVDGAVAAAERLGVLASGALDGALDAVETSELMGALPAAADSVVQLQASRFAAEALAAATHSAPFLQAAKKAGEAALHVVAAEGTRAAAPVPGARVVERPGLFARLRGALGGLTVPLAFAATAATLFFVLREPGSASSDLSQREAAKKALFDALAPAVIADSVDLAAADMPLLADNSADVEAIDATGTTMVFATEQSNITVIWVGDSDDSQGT